MRIIAGRWAGRDLTSPGRRVRPTSEPVRGALFDWLGTEIKGLHVLDLFAGSGALGLEALSRGAASLDLVEVAPVALHGLKANVARLRGGPKGWGRRTRGPGDRRAAVRVFKRDALQFVADRRLERYDLALADPPYASSLATRLAEHWFATPFSTVLVIEHGDAPPPTPPKRSGIRSTRRELSEGNWVTRYDAR